MRRISGLTGLTLVSAALLFFLGCGGGGYGGGGYGGGGGGGGGGIVTNIVITPSTAGITVGKTQQFTAVTKDSNGNMVTGATLTWASSNTAVATVDSSGLATGVSAGSSSITASITYNSGGVYTTGPGTTYTSNMATLNVTVSADSVMGTAAVGHALSGALITLKDADGKSQTAVSGDDGRFQLSTAGLKAPYLLKADDGRGHVLFGASATSGVVANLDTVTDVMVRAWYGVHGSTPEAAFADMGAHPAPDAKSLTLLDKQFTGLLGMALSTEGLDSHKFSLFSTPFSADGKGFDAVLDNTRTLTGKQLELQDALAGQVTQIGFEGKSLSFSVSREGLGADTSAMMQRLELP